MELTVNWGTSSLMVDVAVVNPLTPSKLEQAAKEIRVAAKLRKAEKAASINSLRKARGILVCRLSWKLQ